MRQIDALVACHFASEAVQDVDQGHSRRKVFFGKRPDLKWCDVLLVAAVIDSGVTQEFLLRRLGESQPGSLQ